MPDSDPLTTASLAGVLARHGIALDARDVRDLVAGVAAAAGGWETDAWMRLIDPAGSPEVRRYLTALLDAERAKSPNDEPSEVRVAALRQWLAARRFEGFVVPRNDVHQGEFVSARAERLRWLTGFRGSAGTAVVLARRAALFVDGRYTAQAAQEVDTGVFEIRHAIDEPMADWIGEHLPPGGRLGYDPWLTSPTQVQRLEQACVRAGGRAIAVVRNPIDILWIDQPPPPLAPIVVFDEHYAGTASADKRRAVADALHRDRHDAAFLSAPDSIAWLLNIRGGDVPFSPLPLAFAVVHADASVDLFVDPRKLTPPVIAHLGTDVRVLPPEQLTFVLDRLAADQRTVRIDADLTPQWVNTRLRRRGADVVFGADPCVLPKAIKNSVEREGLEAAHVRDGAALCRFLAWLTSSAPHGGITELDAADRLEVLRAEHPLYRGPSFPTISAFAANGAVIHYRVSAATNRTLAPGSLYLVDSGGQYPDGTTDVTRTIAVGSPCTEMRRRFTLVLKGHIELATVRFPEGTTGTSLDSFARRSLWQQGLDYDHGTGHGVGCYLGVHEGPQRISKLPNPVPLKPGMLLSNEPGYYKPGAYGIRIENLVLVVPSAAPDGAERDLLGFKTLTLAPIDRTLIEASLLSEEERDWLDAYHRRVFATIAPLLDAAAAAWLEDATRPLAD
jgi:Xaa-Pro aminopeptidase